MGITRNTRSSQISMRSTAVAVLALGALLELQAAALRPTARILVDSCSSLRSLAGAHRVAGAFAGRFSAGEGIGGGGSRPVCGISGGAT